MKGKKLILLAIGVYIIYYIYQQNSQVVLNNAPLLSPSSPIGNLGGMMYNPAFGGGFYGGSAQVFSGPNRF